jgi:hypothetical protein
LVQQRDAQKACANLAPFAGKRSRTQPPADIDAIKKKEITKKEIVEAREALAHEK